MQKVAMFLAGVLLFAGASQAQQDWRFGPKLGVSLSNTADISGTDARTGLVFGVAADYRINENFSMTPELLWAQRGSETDLEDIEISYAQIPVLFWGWMSQMDWRYGGFIGPVLAFNVSEDVEGSPIGDVSTFDFLFAVGGGVEWQDWRFEARWDIGVTDIGDDGGRNTAFSILATLFF